MAWSNATHTLLVPCLLLLGCVACCCHALLLPGCAAAHMILSATGSRKAPNAVTSSICAAHTHYIRRSA
jgi:hypothetical protein